MKTKPSLFAPHPTLKQQAAERARLIALLGMEPEDGTRDGRYAATTGELWKWAREAGHEILGGAR